MQKTLKLKLYKKYLIRKHYQNVKINGIIFINEEFHWPKIWTIIKRLDINNKIKELQWKCIHNIIYAESRLRKMNLFFKCSIANCFISKITILISTLEMGTVNINEKNIMFGFNIGGKHEFLLYTLIFISKWSIWKAGITLNITKFVSIKLYFIIYGNGRRTFEPQIQKYI